MEFSSESTLLARWKIKLSSWATTSKNPINPRCDGLVEHVTMCFQSGAAHSSMRAPKTNAASSTYRFVHHELIQRRASFVRAENRVPTSPAAVLRNNKKSKKKCAHQMFDVSRFQFSTIPFFSLCALFQNWFYWSFMRFYYWPAYRALESQVLLGRSFASR